MDNNIEGTHLHASVRCTRIDDDLMDLAILAKVFVLLQNLVSGWFVFRISD